MDYTDAQKAYMVRLYLPHALDVSEAEILAAAAELGDRWELGAFRMFVAQVIADMKGAVYGARQIFKKSCIGIPLLGPNQEGFPYVRRFTDVCSTSPL